MSVNSQLKPDPKPMRQDQGLGNPPRTSPNLGEVAPAEESGRIFVENGQIFTSLYVKAGRGLKTISWFKRDAFDYEVVESEVGELGVRFKPKGGGLWSPIVWVTGGKRT
jgi:hypothetical protein